MKKASLATVVLALALAGCGGGDKDGGGLGSFGGGLSADSSWQPGQTSLFAYPEFLRIAERAFGLGASRWSAYAADVARREAEKRAAAIRRQQELQRRYERLRAAAKRRYERALAEARSKRADALRRAEEARRRLEALERLQRERLKVRPGEECNLPEIRDSFDCRTGRLPTAKRKKK